MSPLTGRLACRVKGILAVCNSPDERPRRLSNGSHVPLSRYANPSCIGALRCIFSNWLQVCVPRLTTWPAEACTLHASLLGLHVAAGHQSSRGWPVALPRTTGPATTKHHHSFVKPRDSAKIRRWECSSRSAHVPVAWSSAYGQASSGRYGRASVSKCMITDDRLRAAVSFRRAMETSATRGQFQIRMAGYPQLYRLSVSTTHLLLTLQTDPVHENLRPATI